MKSHIERVLHELERDNERISAYLRLVVVAALTALFLSWDRSDPHNLSALGLVVYAGIALCAVGLAHAGFFRPWLPWLFVTLDVCVVFWLLILGAQALGMQMTGILSLPTSSLIFVLLAHAAMRHQSGLVGYVAALSLGLWIASLTLIETEHAATGMGTMLAGSMGADRFAGHALAQEIVRALLIVLTAVILIVTVVRTKRRVLELIVAARRTANLSRFLPKELAEKLSLDGHHGVAESRRLNVSIMFIDIRGFSSLAEHADPAELGRFLTEFRRRLSAPILTHHGVIDKFIGDAIMAVFGIPEPSGQDARNALNCGLEILRRLDHWNEARCATGLESVEVGIGLHYGEVIAGVLGHEERLEYTVIGATVNTAERLERLTRTVESDLVVSAQLLAAAGETPEARQWIELPRQKLRGHEEVINAYQYIQDI